MTDAAQVMSFYSNALDILKSVPISSHTLEELSPFLSSAFVRVPAPALGPQAFRAFWRAISPALNPSNHIPHAINECLQIVRDFFGDDMDSKKLSNIVKAPEGVSRSCTLLRCH